MDLIYINTPDSGLGDRILDIMTIYSYSKILNCNNLYVYWKYENHLGRYLELENLLNYIIFPKDLYFFSKQEKELIINKNKNNIIFNDSLGAISLYLFSEKYLKDEEHKKLFYKTYFESFNKLKFKNIPENIKEIFDKNLITTIHLRRTDKISNNKYTHGTDIKELELLNSATQRFINKQIKNNILVCIISDDKEIKNEYIEYNKNNIISFETNDKISQVYIDFYCLANSHTIFMSQKFSTYSIVASLINNTKLYYYFDYGRLFEFDNLIYNFYKYPNFSKFID